MYGKALVILLCATLAWSSPVVQDAETQTEQIIISERRANGEEGRGRIGEFVKDTFENIGETISDTSNKAIEDVNKFIGNIFHRGNSTTTPSTPTSSTQASQSRPIQNMFENAFKKIDDTRKHAIEDMKNVVNNILNIGRPNNSTTTTASPSTTLRPAV